MPVPKLVCEVACVSGFASYMDGDVPWDTRSYVRKARPNSIALEKGNLGTHMRAISTRLLASKACHSGEPRLFLTSQISGQVRSQEERKILGFLVLRLETKLVLGSFRKRVNLATHHQP
jgi:hypothetical protein